MLARFIKRAVYIEIKRTTKMLASTSKTGFRLWGVRLIDAGARRFSPAMVCAQIRASRRASAIKYIFPIQTWFRPPETPPLVTNFAVKNDIADSDIWYWLEADKSFHIFFSDIRVHMSRAAAQAHSPLMALWLSSTISADSRAAANYDYSSLAYDIRRALFT